MKTILAVVLVILALVLLGISVMRYTRQDSGALVPLGATPPAGGGLMPAPGPAMPVPQNVPEQTEPAATDVDAPVADQ